MACQRLVGEASGVKPIAAQFFSKFLAPPYSFSSFMSLRALITAVSFDILYLGVENVIVGAGIRFAIGESPFSQRVLGLIVRRVRDDQSRHHGV
jgi:hypothetical protein